jgi:O-antigen/teichoic acid export membrane protein
MNLLRRNVLFLLFSQVATWLVTAVLLVVGPDKLGATSYGRLGLAAAYIGFFTLIGSLGTYPYLVKHISRDFNELSVLVNAALRLKIVLGLLLSAIAIGLSFLIGYGREERILIAIGCLGMMFLMFNEMVMGGLAGMERLARSAFWQTVQTYVGTIGAIIVVLTTKSTIMYALALVLAWLIPVVANFHRLRPMLRGPRSPRPKVWKALVVGGIPMFVLQVFNLTYSTIDVPLLEWLSTTEVVGWYTLAYRWVGMPIFITSIVVTAFLPRLSMLASEPEPFNNMLNQAVRLVLLVNIPLAVGLALVADDLMTMLYGNKFSNSVVLIQLLCPFIPLVGLNTVVATGLIAADRHLRYLWVAGSAAILNPPIAIFVIHWAQHRYGNGAKGAAVLTVVTEIAITICAVHMRVRGSTDRSTLAYSLRCFLAGATMVPFVLLVNDAGIAVKIVVGGIVYGLASLALRTVTPSIARGLLSDLKSVKQPMVVPDDAPGAEVPLEP